MSVHGEYSRALESLISRVRMLSRDERESWLRDLERARVDRNPDLTTAARTCREALEAIATVLDLDPDPLEPPRSPDADYLHAAHDHLLAHCRAVLGSAT